MNNKTTALTLLSILLLIAYIPMAFAHNAPFPGGYDPTLFVLDTIGDPETMDPAWAYDTASAEVISQVYETLVFFNVNWEEGPHANIIPGKTGAGTTDSFYPRIASAMPTIDYTSSVINPKTGDPYYSTWYFPIRTTITFHDGNTLTPADVEYSFEREMIQDRDGGPQWMLFEPLLEKYYAAEVSEPYGADGEEINFAVQSNSTHVWFNLVAAYPELAVLQIWAQSWCSVVEKAWAVGRGDFDGDWTADWATEIFATWHNPEVSFLDSPDPDMMGSGPYKFSYWNSGVDYSVIRNTVYWDGWPAKASSSVGGVGDTTTLGGYVDTVTWRELASWTVRRGNYLAGTSDETVVPRSYRDQVLGQIVGGEKIRNFFPVQPILSCNGFFFTFDVSTTSLYMGTPLPPGTFGTNGIPPDIFTDINVRKGFAYAFNYANFLALAFLNEGTQPADPVIPGLAYDNVANNKYSQDLTKAAYYLKLSWGGVDNAPAGPPWGPEDVPGDLWTGGMKFQTVYNIGNVPRELASVEIANEINTLNPSKFFIETLGLDWGTQVLPAMVASELPMFHIGWLADYADPHDFVFPFQHSFGTFSQFQRYSNAVVDALVVAGIATPDDTTAYAGQLDVGDPRPLMTNWREETDPQAYIDSPIDSRWPRRAIYYALQALWFDDLPTILYLQGLGRHFEQTWTHGWYYNSLYPGGYYYHRWKSLTHFGDVSSSATYGIADGAIDTFDAAFVSAHWSSPVSLYGYHPTSDVNGGIGALTGGLTGPVRGMPDGKVDIVDLGLISAYWDNPAGPSHP